MKKKIILSILVILFVTAVSLGATMAWFTASEEIPKNEFTAGTVEITAYDSWVQNPSDAVYNWNPGDCDDKVVKVTYTGTKKAFLRMEITESWTAKGATVPWVTRNDRNIENVTWKNWNDPVKWYYGSDGFWYYDGFKEGLPDSWPKFTLTLFGGGTKVIHAINGTFDGQPSTEITVVTEVCLKGSNTGNQYQGATYSLEAKFQAIQASHYGGDDGWNWGDFDSYNPPPTTP